MASAFCNNLGGVNQIKVIRMAHTYTYIKDGAAHAEEWKERFLANASAQYPGGVRERYHGANIHTDHGHVHVRVWASGDGVYMATHSSSVARGFAVFFLVIGIFALIGSIVSVVFAGYFNPAGFIVLFIISGILFSVNDNRAANDEVFALAKKTWDEVTTSTTKALGATTSVVTTAPNAPKGPVVPYGEASVVAPAPAEDPKNPRYCGSCGASLHAGARFCVICGSEV
jgi:hypothetical protein